MKMGVLLGKMRVLGVFTYKNGGFTMKNEVFGCFFYEKWRFWEVLHIKMGGFTMKNGVFGCFFRCKNDVFTYKNCIFTYPNGVYGLFI
jgi:hypothetical protein